MISGVGGFRWWARFCLSGRESSSNGENWLFGHVVYDALIVFRLDCADATNDIRCYVIGCSQAAQTHTHTHTRAGDGAVWNNNKLTALVLCAYRHVLADRWIGVAVWEHRLAMARGFLVIGEHIPFAPSLSTWQPRLSYMCFVNFDSDICSSFVASLSFICCHIPFVLKPESHRAKLHAILK